MNELVYPRERTLGTITLVLGVLAWLGLIAGTFGGALIGLGVGFVIYLFLHSALIAHIKGNGVELSQAQFPDLWAQFLGCCERLQMAPPRAYVLNGDGGLNAFATKFLGAQYVVLLADVVDAMHEHPDGVRFYLGHELGHLRMKHLQGTLLRWPALWVPLLGAAYSRARESTCDRHGLACSSSPEGAARAMAALSAGTQRWKGLDLPAYVEQAKHSSEFWMSFHELTAGYPWLTKRVARVLDPQRALPRRSTPAHVLAAFVPFAGRLGGGFAVLMMLYVFIILGAIAVPAFKDLRAKAVIAAAAAQTPPLLDGLTRYYGEHQQPPASLDQAGLPTKLTGATLTLDPENMVLQVETDQGGVRYEPTIDDQEQLHWTCFGSAGVKQASLPDGCIATPAIP